MATAVVLAGGGVALALLSLGKRRPHVPLLGLAVVAVAAHAAEHELLTSVLPRLLR